MNDWNRALNLRANLFYCSIIDELTLQGNELSNQYSFYEFQYARCRGSCVTDPDLQEDYFREEFMTFFVVESYYDANDQDEPVKQFISSDSRIPLSNSESSTMNMYIRENELRLLNGTVKTFYDIDETRILTK